MSKRNIFLIALLAIQVSIIAFVNRPVIEATSQVVRFFEPFAVGQITGLTITDDKANSVVISKDGEGWQLKAAGEQYPANSSKVQELLTKLAVLQSKRLVTRTRGSQVRLKVSSEVFNRRIEVRDGSGGSRAIYLGTSPSFKAIHVRLDGSSEVYLANDLSIWEASTEANSWWRGDYLDLDPARVSSLELTNANGVMALEKKDEAGQWYLRRADSGQVSVESVAVGELLSKITKITLNEYLGRKGEASYGLDAPAATVTFRLDGGDEVGLVVGPVDEKDSSHVIKSTGSPFHVRVGSHAVQGLLAADGAGLPVVESPYETAPDGTSR